MGAKCCASAKVSSKAANTLDQLNLKLGMYGGYNKAHSDRAEYPNPSWEHLEEALDVALEFLEVNREAALLVNTKALARYYTLQAFHVMGHVLIMSHSARWAIEYGRERLVNTLERYDRNVDRALYRQTGKRINWLHSGLFLCVLIMQYGELPVAKMWYEHALVGWNFYRLDELHEYEEPEALAGELGELTLSALPTLILLGRRGWAAELLRAIGFADWSGRGFEEWWQVGGKRYEPWGTFPRASWVTLIRLLLVCAFGFADRRDVKPIASVGFARKHEVEAWIPSPEALAELNKAWFTQTLGCCSLLNLGARVYEKLGNFVAAQVTAELGLFTQKKKLVAADCHCVLGRLALRRKDAQGSDAHYREACSEAREARMYMFEVIAAREWGRGEANSIIKDACQIMGKNPEGVGYAWMGDRSKSF